MLLKYLRKKTRAILIGTLILIIPAFIFLYGWSRLSTKEKIPYVIAKVGSIPITWNEYQTELTRYKNLLGSSYSSEVEKQIEKQVLDGMIEKCILLKEAKKRNIKVNDDEVILRMRGIFSNEEGEFDKEKFRLISNQYPEEINALEESIRIQITIDKLKDIVTNSVNVSEDGVYKYFLTSDAKAKIKYISVKPEDLRKDIKISEQELKDYYEQHRESFKDGPWRKVEYVLIGENKIDKGEIQVEPEEVEEYYSQHSQEWVGENGDTEVLPLAEVNPVRNNSGGFQDTAPLPHQQTDSAEISNGVKDKIEKELKEKKKEEILKDTAFQTSLKLLEKNDWNSFAKNEGLSYGTTGYFSKEEPIPELDRKTIINQTAFTLPFNEISEPLRIEKGYAIIRPLNEEPKYEEVADKIREIIADEKSKQLTWKIAEDIMSELSKGEKTTEDVVKKYSLEVKESGYFSRYGLIENIGYIPEVTQAAFSSDKEKWNKVSIASGEIFITQTIDVKEPSPEGFQEAKERITTLLLYQKKQKVFLEWLKELKEKNENKVSILWDELLSSR